MMGGNSLLLLRSPISPCDLIPIFLSKRIPAHEEFDPVLYEISGSVTSGFCGMAS